MRICGLQKLSLLDFPGYAAATVFTGGCNLRCPFCHNAALVTAETIPEIMSESELFGFLKKRHGLLDGVCITGGEPLMMPDTLEFIHEIKALGFYVKLDTNGCFPDRLAALLRDGVLDYIAMDIKNSPEKYAETVGIKGFDTAPVLKSTRLIMGSDVPYEFRTTLVKEFHTPQDIEKTGRLITGANQYFLQEFTDSGGLIGENLHRVDENGAAEMLTAARKFVKNALLRGQ